MDDVVAVQELLDEGAELLLRRAQVHVVVHANLQEAVAALRIDQALRDAVDRQLLGHTVLGRESHDRPNRRMGEQAVERRVASRQRGDPGLFGNVKHAVQAELLQLAGLLGGWRVVQLDQHMDPGIRHRQDRRPVSRCETLFGDELA